MGIVSLVILLIGIFKWGLKKRKFPTKRLLVFLLFPVISSVQFYNQYYNLNYLPAGELNAVFPSPNENYDIHTYHFTGIYGENSKAVLVNTETEKENTVYFNWYDYDPQVEWVNNDIVKIGREELSIHQDTYDYRHDSDSLRTLPPQRVMH
jgi:hypothetical protein